MNKKKYILLLILIINIGCKSGFRSSANIEKEDTISLKSGFINKLYINDSLYLGFENKNGKQKLSLLKNKEILDEKYISDTKISPEIETCLYKGEKIYYLVSDIDYKLIYYYLVDEKKGEIHQVKEGYCTDLEEDYTQYDEDTINYDHNKKEVNTDYVDNNKKTDFKLSIIENSDESGQFLQLKVSVGDDFILKKINSDEIELKKEDKDYKLTLKYRDRNGNLWKEKGLKIIVKDNNFNVDSALVRTYGMSAKNGYQWFSKEVVIDKNIEDYEF